MNTAAIEKIADAILYEGYLLYPYRASAVKNKQRFNFGVLYPPGYSELQTGSDPSAFKTEFLLIGEASATIQGKMRFLQLVESEHRQEGQEREFGFSVCSVGSVTDTPFRQHFGFDSETLAGSVEISAVRVDSNLSKITLIIQNDTELPNPSGISREDVLLRSFISLHSILHAYGAEFVSLLDPPDSFKTAAAECHNAGLWPVLVGEEGETDTVLCSPIILYDYPQIAPESAGDLFDGTEIDEILALRILTMTEAEKLEVRNGDDRARRILERTEMLAPEHFQKLHGALRGLTNRPEAGR
jgi:hydrogenase maturation protease